MQVVLVCLVFSLRLPIPIIEGFALNELVLFYLKDGHDSMLMDGHEDVYCILHLPHVILVGCPLSSAAFSAAACLASR